MGAAGCGSPRPNGSSGRSASGPPSSSFLRDRMRPIRVTLQALALAGVASLLALLIWKLTHDPGGGVAAQLSQGKRPAAPNFTLPRLDGEGTVDLAAIKKPRVVDFFASWCYACPYESKRLAKYSWQYGDAIPFVGVNTGAFSSEA